MGKLGNLVRKTVPDYRDGPRVTTTVLMSERGGGVRVREGGGTTEAEVGVMGPRTKECEQSLEAGRGKEADRSFLAPWVFLGFTRAGCGWAGWGGRPLSSCLQGALRPSELRLALDKAPGWLGPSESPHSMPRGHNGASLEVLQLEVPRATLTLQRPPPLSEAPPCHLAPQPRCTGSGRGRRHPP